MSIKENNQICEECAIFKKDLDSLKEEVDKLTIEN